MGGEGVQYGGGAGERRRDKPMNANGIGYAGIAPRWGANIADGRSQADGPLPLT